jgi:hypothetical protein
VSFALEKHRNSSGRLSSGVEHSVVAIRYPIVPIELRRPFVILNMSLYRHATQGC